MGPQPLKKGGFVIRVERLLRKLLNDKIFLVSLKFIFHIEGLAYMLYSILSYFDIDAVYIGYVADISLFPWILMYMLSIRFYFCYVHRLPLYYILINEIITDTDFFIGIPISDRWILTTHILIIGVFIFIYSYYYYERLNKTSNKSPFGWRKNYYR